MARSNIILYRHEKRRLPDDYYSELLQFSNPGFSVSHVDF